MSNSPENNNATTSLPTPASLITRTSTPPHDSHDDNNGSPSSDIGSNTPPYTTASTILPSTSTSSNTRASHHHPSTTTSTTTHPSTTTTTSASTTLPSDYIDTDLTLLSPLTLPGPGQTLILRPLNSTSVLTLISNTPTLCPPGLRGSFLWDCVETEAGWLALRNTVTGKLLGHRSGEALVCEKDVAGGWEGWLFVPAGRVGESGRDEEVEEVQGRWWLVSSHWGRMCRVGVREGKGEAEGEGKGGSEGTGGRLVRFLDEAEGREKALVWEVFRYEGEGED